VYELVPHVFRRRHVLHWNLNLPARLLIYSLQHSSTQILVGSSVNPNQTFVHADKFTTQRDAISNTIHSSLPEHSITKHQNITTRLLSGLKHPSHPRPPLSRTTSIEILSWVQTTRTRVAPTFVGAAEGGSQVYMSNLWSYSLAYECFLYPELRTTPT
jgi:hypothetical protein